MSAKENYIGDPDLMRAFPPSQIEDKLAWMEAAAKARPLLQDSKAANAVIKNQSARKILARLDFNKGVSFEEASDAVAKLYRLSHGNAFSARNLKELGFDGNVDAVIRSKFEEDFARENFATALKELGFLRPSTIADKARGAKKFLAPFFDRMLAVMGALGTTHGTPGLYAPKLSLLERKKMGDELLDKALDGGFDSILPELKSKYGKDAAFDLTWSWMRSAFNGLSMAYVVNWYRDKKIAQDKLNEEMWRQWLARYREVRGRDPDPDSPEYHFNYDRLHGNLDFFFPLQK